MYYHFDFDFDFDFNCGFIFNFISESLESKVIWITGASSGIGEGLAYRLAKVKPKLVLSGTNSERLENVKKNCTKLGEYISKEK